MAKGYFLKIKLDKPLIVGYNRKMKKLPERKKVVFCTNVDRVSELAGKLMERNSHLSETHIIAADIKRLVAQMKEQALAMEKRLYLYKETIEGLGFKRVRK